MSSFALAAVSGRCPRCAKGALFKGFLAIAPACGACGEDFAKADTGDGPAVFVIFIVGALVVPLAFVLLFAFAWPPLAVIAAASAATIALSLALLRPFKGLLFALQWRMKAHEGQLEG